MARLADTGLWRAPFAPPKARDIIGTPESQLNKFDPGLLEEKDWSRVRLRVVARPDRPVAELLIRLGLDLPSAPEQVQNGVEKNQR